MSTFVTTRFIKYSVAGKFKRLPILSCNSLLFQLFVLKSMHVLGGIYYLISPSEMDDFYQWIYDTRYRCFDDGVTVDSLNSDGNSLQIVMGDQIDSIPYLPTGSEWQQEKCRLLGLSFIRSNYIKSKDSVRIGISQAPLATVRIN